MSLAALLTQYITLNALLIISFVGLKVLFILNKNFLYKTKLDWHYHLLFFAAFFTLIHPFIPAKQIFTPTAKVWTAKSLKSFSSDYQVADKGGYLKLDVLGKEKTIDAEEVFNVTTILFIPLSFIVGFFLLRDLHQLGRIRKSSYYFKKYKNVSILLNDDIEVPFSYMLFKTAYVIVPTSLLETPEYFNIAITHEIQHHRQGDTKWIYFIWLLKLLCFFNPAIHLLGREISKLQEFSCDEILIGHKKISEHSYANCLLTVAQTSLLKMKAPLCATGLTFLSEDQILKRRITVMYAPKAKNVSRLFQSLVFSVFLFSLAGGAFASKSFVQDKRVSMRELTPLIKDQKSGIPLELNDLVLKEINRYVGTPEGREFFKASMKRMELYRGMIEGKIMLNRLPLELLAIPIVESGYQNLPQDPDHKSWGAGIWMFIKSTARIYGLRVDENVDERLDPILLTDAALKYFQSNHALFNDWHLSILAYNIGENAVKKAMIELKTDSAWTIIRNGRENDKDYLPRVMAAIIILKNPDLLK